MLPPKSRNLQATQPRTYYAKDLISWRNFQPRQVDLDSNDRPKKARRSRYNRQSMEHAFRFMPFQHRGFELLSKPPRSFEELQTERSYLLNSLQREDYKATELLKSIAALQESLQESLTNAAYRRVRNQLRWLETRMGECAKQEKAILRRLGQVAYEIQAKERWSRIENERRHELTRYGMQHMQLDATCPAFTPYKAYSYQCPVQELYENTYYSEYPQPPVQECASDLLALSTSCEPDYSPAVVSGRISTRRASSMINLTAPMEKEKRPSMPAPNSAAAGHKASMEGDPQYVGYYIGNPVQ